MLFDALHPCYAGDVGIGINPTLGEAVKRSDLLVLVGARMSEMPSSDYTLLKSPYPDQQLVHVYPDAGELGRVYRPTLPIVASPSAFAEAFAANLPDTPPPFADQTTTLHGGYLTWSTPPETGPGAVAMGPIIEYLREKLPEDAILCTAPATMPPGCTASTASVVSRRKPRPPLAPWATARRRRSRQK